MSQFRIGVSADFYSEAREHLENVMAARLATVPGVEIVPLPDRPDKHAAPQDLSGIDALFALATKVDEASLEGVERLVVVSRWGVGYDRIDTEALTRHDVALTITPNSVRRPVAEAIFTFLFALSKNLFLQDRTARAGKWRGDLPKFGQSIQGRVLGSVGCGNIGQEMFRMAASLGFSRLIACDPAVTRDQVKDLGVEIVDMDTVFRESDYVAVNTLLNASTKGLVRERHFRLMKPTAYFVNTSRGPIVEHEALVRALREEWIAGAGIDVFPVEPVPGGHDSLFDLDNVIVAPHAMAWTSELMFNNGSEACDHVLAVSRGEVPPTVVNRAVLESPEWQAKLARFR